MSPVGARARVLVMAGALGLVLGTSRSSRADGAFPASQAVLLPRDQPQTIVLATTFGLVVSDDDGQHWQYSCEALATQNGYRYRLGAPPNNRIHAISDHGLPVSNDGGCSWSLAGGALAGAQGFDVFPDMVDPSLVFALAYPTGAPDDAPAAPYRSNDGGRTYVGPIKTLAPGAATTGIESAESAPGVVYMTWYEGDQIHPRLSVSDDGGVTWSTVDLEESLGPVTPYLVAVDPIDPRRIYVRIIGGRESSEKFEALASSPDGGKTWSSVLTLPKATLAGFARQEDGTLWVLATLDRVSHLYRSEDGGATFSDAALPFTATGLAERAGTLYVPIQGGLGSDGGVGLVSSADGGQTWRSRLDFGAIMAVRACVASTCHADCRALAEANLFPATTCGAGATGEKAPGAPTGAGSRGCSVTPPNQPEERGTVAALLATLVGLAFWPRTKTSRRSRDASGGRR